MDERPEEDRLIWEPIEPDEEAAALGLVSEGLVRMILELTGDTPCQDERVIVF
jgi:hypothetical protein